MLQLQCRPYTVPSCSPFGVCSRRSKQCTQLRLRNAGVLSAISGLRPGNGLGYWILSNVSVPRSCNYLGISKRDFGTVSCTEAIIEDRNRYDKFFKLAAQSKTKASKDVDDTLPLGEDVSGEAKAGLSVLNAQIGDDKTKSSGRKKRQSRSKQKEVESSGAVASEEAVSTAKSPKSTKRSSNSESGKSLVHDAEVGEVFYTNQNLFMLPN